MIVEISFFPPALSPVTAVTVTNPVTSVPEFVMNAFDPLITQVSPSSTARVRVPPASVPQPGSVRPNAPIRSPVTSRGSHSAFCASVPKRAIGIAPSDTAASSVIATDESTRASSSSTRQSAK
jgi:hypothetical protein